MLLAQAVSPSPSYLTCRGALPFRQAVGNQAAVLSHGEHKQLLLFYGGKEIDDCMVEELSVHKVVRRALPEETGVRVWQIG